jgi:hypothetical protein
MVQAKWMQEREIPREVWQAFVNLTPNRDMQTIVAWLEKARQSEDDLYAELGDDVPLRWCQGRASTLRRILHVAKNAPTMLKTLK